MMRKRKQERLLLLLTNGKITGHCNVCPLVNECPATNASDNTMCFKRIAYWFDNGIYLPDADLSMYKIEIK